MIKRRFYKRGHAGDCSDSSSSSSDSDSDSIPQTKEEEEEELEEKQEEDDDEEEEEEEEEEEDNDDDEITVERSRSEIKKNKKEKKRNKRNMRSPSTGSGYESEDSSANEVKVNSSGFLTSEEDSIEKGGESMKKANTKDTGQGASKAGDRTLNSTNAIESDFADCILRYKSVFKCRLCPRIVCLNEDTVKAHLNSKRHARSKKLLAEGRLKLMLNSDGDIEEDVETHAERHARTIALAQEPVAASGKKDTECQRLRRKKKLRNSSNKGKSDEASKTPHKKRRKNES